jgi:hypothetical protein
MTTQNDNDVWGDFSDLMDEVHKEAETAARKKETNRLLETTDWLRRAKELETRQHELVRQAERLVAERRTPVDSKKTNVEKLQSGKNEAEVTTSNDLGGKPRADECRGAYLSRERKRGNILSHIRRSYYKNPAGLSVGITWSKEDTAKSCPWFLNLLDGEFDEAVLLCEISKEAVQVIHLPKTFFDRYGKQMSRGKKGQIKFNVSKRNGHFHLQVPKPVGWIDIADYTDKEPLICPRDEFI